MSVLQFFFRCSSDNDDPVVPVPAYYGTGTKDSRGSRAVLNGSLDALHPSPNTDSGLDAKETGQFDGLCS